MNAPRKPPANRPLKRAPGEPARISRACKDEEHQHQAALIEWCQVTRHPRHERPISEWIYAVANGGHRSLAQGARLKAEGVKAGVWDLHLAYPMFDQPGAWIEMKSADGRLSHEQISWGDLMRSTGYACYVCRSVDDGIAAIKHYLGMP